MSKDARDPQAILAAEVEASIQRGSKAQDDTYKRWYDNWLSPQPKVEYDELSDPPANESDPGCLNT